MKPTKQKDTVYASPRAKIEGFVFDDAVVEVFPDMIRRSVPGYSNSLAMIGLFSARYVQEGSTCYDLGCSLGAATLAMARGIEGQGSSVIAIDNAPAMVEKCREYVKAAGLSTPIDVQCEDIRTLQIKRASVVVLNYTLQFIPPDERIAILKKIYDGMLAGGILVISEKLAFADPNEQELMTRLHLDFKRAHGYSELEISQKRTALENVLIPDTLETHNTRLKAAGFENAYVWQRCLNFASLITLKK